MALKEAAQASDGSMRDLIANSSRGAAAEFVVRAFLQAQDDKDLDVMCELFAQDGEYLNDPLPEEKQIRGRAKFRKVFSMSPCIFAEVSLQRRGGAEAAGVVLACCGGVPRLL